MKDGVPSIEGVARSNTPSVQIVECYRGRFLSMRFAHLLPKPFPINRIAHWSISSSTIQIDSTTAALPTIHLHHRQIHMPSKPASLPVQMFLELLAKLLHESQYGHGRRVAQRAKGPAHHVLRQVLNVVDVF